MSNIIEAKLSNGVIIHKDASGKIFRYAAVRGGLSWPSADAPGFYIILGEEWRGPTKYEGEKQKKGKKRMRQIGNVEVPQTAFLAVLKLD